MQPIAGEEYHRHLPSWFMPFAVALVSGAALAWPILKALVALKARQTIYSLAPETHQKKQGTPTMGGLIILAGLLAALLIVDQMWFVAAWLLGFALLGFADDYIVPRLAKEKRGLGWKQKFAGQVILAGLAPLVFGIPVTVATEALFIFVVLFYCNAYNFADGLDGLAGSLGLILCLGFYLLSDGRSGLSMGDIVVALAGAYIPFLFLNAPPAKVFMGDVGSLPLGALFGAAACRILVVPWTGMTPYSSAVILEWHPEMILPVIILSLVMVAELVPVPLQVGFYKLTKKRIFPMTPIHHAFEVKGWPESRVVWSFFLAQFILMVLAVATFLWNIPATSNLSATSNSQPPHSEPWATLAPLRDASQRGGIAAAPKSERRRPRALDPLVAAQEHACA